ncbi:putative mediator complex subunit Med5 [Lyophyllum shimeji]|uniref:Mediator of RNA polymerase II transcription subunit 5 n=1 Tax=Lyophyllum shimeji TaxID=47721 RepID=A0A9P3UM09_LYOSH|nr:putative mediator complex subunit Med5 [Lyophyllum shimeji]
MFSQFRQAVENLAPAAPRESSDGTSADTRREPVSRSGSLDSPLRSASPMSSSQLAESALSNLRKSLASQRSGSVGSIPRNASPTPSREGRTKSTLEERLRAATFAIGDASNATSPEPSRKPSPAITSVVSDHPLSASPAPPPDSVQPSPKNGTSIPTVNHEAGSVDTPAESSSQPLQSETLASSESAADATSGGDSGATSSVNSEGETSQSVPTRSSPLPDHITGTPELERSVDTEEENLLASEPTPTPQSSVPAEGEPSRDDGATSQVPNSAPTSSDATVPSGSKIHVVNLEELQERLRQVEQRFTDVSTSFKRLQAEKQAADLVLRELTPLESIQDSSALRDYFRSITSKAEIFQDEIKRLNGKLEVQEDRVEELRDTHCLESASQSAQIEKLRTQLSEAEALLKAAQTTDAEAEATAAARIAEIEQLHRELERAKLLAKEEEEKRVKAISLLKTVRQKLVKAEKEKEDAMKEMATIKERDKGEKEREQAERVRLRNELDAAGLEKERAVEGLRAQFDKELAGLRDRYEKELTAIRAQYELESASIKNAHAQEISSKNLHIRSLEQSLSLVTKDKNGFFDDLQLRQAELESAQSHLESLQSQNTEYQYQLRELGDRYALLKEDFAEAQREQETRTREPATSADEVARLLSVAEAKYESKLSELKRNLSALEKERNDVEADWSRKLRDKTSELEDLKRLVGSVTRMEQQHEDVVAGLKVGIGKLEGECRLLQGQLHEVRQSYAQVREAEKSWKSLEQELSTKISALEQQLDEIKQREAQLRLGNKTLREELRKVQSSAALLERQRNPGVGYWTSRSTDSNPTASQASVNSTSSEAGSRVTSPEPGIREKNTANDEEVNLEYLRNVILQFLEHKEMRPNLVKLVLESAPGSNLSNSHSTAASCYSKIASMSLAELTRNCFQSGVSPSKWLELCKLLVSKEAAARSQNSVEVDLSNSVLVLYRSYPGDPNLQEYLKHAIADGSLPVSTFVATLLQAARSPELHTPATLDTLCRFALDAHYSSGLPPIGSVVSYKESQITVLGIVQDALALLRTAHSLPLSHFHQLTNSASELVILLLSCVSDISQVSTAQAMVHFADANDLLQNFRLTQDVRQVLETFVLSLSLLIGDDAKAAREAQIMHTIQLALGKGNFHGPGSETDIITFSLVFHHLVSYRAHEFGSGDGSGSVALLVALFRWAAWSPTVFYTQMFLSAFMSLSQCSSDALLWKGFIVGRLPHLLTRFQSVVNADGVSSADWKSALQPALLTVSRQSDLIAQCDHAISRAKEVSVVQEDEPSQSFFRDLLQNMIALDLIPTAFAIGIDPSISNSDLSRLRIEAQESGAELEGYLEAKFIPDNNVTELRSWMGRVLQDVTIHSTFTAVIVRRFTALATTFDVDSLSHLCKVLYTYDAALDIVALHMKIPDLIFRSLSFLDQYDCETVGDPQTAVSHLGDVVLFVQYVTSRFHLETDLYKAENRSLASTFLKCTDSIYPTESLSGEDAAAFGAWSKALFDSGSEGIEDNILRSTRPKTLLKISATLFLQAIKANLAQKIDRDTLSNGVSYFTGPLLNWTLVGIIKALVKEIQQKGFGIPVHMEILQTLLLSPSCPRPVRALCAAKVFVLLSNKRGQAAMVARNIDIASMRRVVTEAIGLPAEGEHPLQQSVFAGRVTWEDEPRQVIQTALALARTGKAPAMDVQRCIKIMPPTKFLQLLWSELVIAASVGEMENCRRVATFVLTMPRCSSTPPLLPLFLHVVTPSLIFAIDHQQLPEHAMKVELLVTIISAALTAALHLELGIRSVTGEHRIALGHSSAGMARKLAMDLRSRRDHTSRAMLQRLASLQSFAANFPVFMSELG